MSKKNNIEIVVVLDNIRSMNNIGSIFRSSDAFDVKKIFLCGICATPPNREIHKTALGATESVEWEYVSSTTDAINKLIREKFQITVIEQGVKSKDLSNYEHHSKKIALVFGNEVNGVSAQAIDLANDYIQIEQFGLKSSMNVAVVAGIVLWKLSKSPD
tara:strand:- start:610 stop:1086 length:477 start_codon:yes stop_codon:yes gene_type:complete